MVVKQMLESWKLLCGGVGVSFSTIPGGGIFSWAQSDVTCSALRGHPQPWSSCPSPLKMSGRSQLPV